MIDLTVIIINWNTADLLKNCLDSLLNRVQDHQMEVIVVDNGSADQSGDMVKTRFPSVILIENATNAGFARACNQAFGQSRGRYRLLLNPDTLIGGGFIDSLIAFMDQDADIGIAGVQLLNSDGSLQNTISNTPTLLTELFNKTVLRWISPERFPGKEAPPQAPIEVESLVGACLMVRAEMLEKIGLLDEVFFLFYEETDLCLRARERGWKVIFHPRLTLHHFQGRSMAKQLSRARIEYWHSRYIFFRKHYGRTCCLILSIILLTKLLVNAFLISFLALFSKKWQGRLRIYGKILQWHLKGLPDEGGLRPSEDDLSPNGGRPASGPV